jgi:23S rRNA pseudouridine2605 synthase
MGQSYFQKFVPKKKNSVVKEEHRQAKKKAKKERAAAIDKFYEEKRKQKEAVKQTIAKAPVTPVESKRQKNTPVTAPAIK